MLSRTKTDNGCDPQLIDRQCVVSFVSLSVFLEHTPPLGLQTLCFVVSFYKSKTDNRLTTDGKKLTKLPFRAP